MKKTLLLLVVLCCTVVALCACQNRCEHQYQEVVTTEASCTIAGVKTCICSLCQKAYTEEIPPTGHQYITETKAATCIEDGQESILCEKCGDVKSSHTIEKGEHHYVLSSSTQATCTSAGVENYVCSICNHKKSTNISRLGHTTYKGVCSRCSTAVGLSKTEIQQYIQIAGVVVHEPNSADGCDVVIAYKNTSKKQIKYLDFWVTPYNGVLDVVKCTVRKESTRRLYVVGPINAGYANYDENCSDKLYFYTARTRWDNVWYNGTIQYIKLEKIMIEYMDGTIVIIDADLISYVFIPCRDNCITYKN